ncbi:MAG: transcription antitermination factor NusB [Clostridiaceae bacterium]|nr:transcription antitermination factor NusB [Clostridiaceae bacterium]
MSRRESREAAFRFLYQLEFRTDDPQDQLEIFLENYSLQENDLDFFKMIVTGVSEKKKALDEIYSPYLIGWKIDRIPKTDLILLRIACYEMLFVDSIPNSVSISEAIILAKRYSSEEAKKYINAILGKVGSEEAK